VHRDFVYEKQTYQCHILASLCGRESVKKWLEKLPTSCLENILDPDMTEKKK